MIELDLAIYFEDDTGTSQGPREILFKEHPVFIPVLMASFPISSFVIDQHVVATIDDESIEEVDPVAPDVAMDIPLRMSERVRRPAISYDYIVYL